MADRTVMRSGGQDLARLMEGTEVDVLLVPAPNRNCTAWSPCA
jgi:hypothetical protein